MTRSRPLSFSRAFIPRVSGQGWRHRDRYVVGECYPVLDTFSTLNRGSLDWYEVVGQNMLKSGRKKTRIFFIGKFLYALQRGFKVGKRFFLGWLQLWPIRS